MGFNSGFKGLMFRVVMEWSMGRDLEKNTQFFSGNIFIQFT